MLSDTSCICSFVRSVKGTKQAVRGRRNGLRLKWIWRFVDGFSGVAIPDPEWSVEGCAARAFLVLYVLIADGCRKLDDFMCRHWFEQICYRPSILWLHKIVAQSIGLEVIIGCDNILGILVRVKSSLKALIRFSSIYIIWFLYSNASFEVIGNIISRAH